MGQFWLAEEVEIACCQNASMPTALVAYFHLDYTFIHHTGHFHVMSARQHH